MDPPELGGLWPGYIVREDLEASKTGIYASPFADLFSKLRINEENHLFSLLALLFCREAFLSWSLNLGLHTRTTD